MPSVQFLPYVPSFGEKLASSFGQAAGNIGHSFIQNKKKEGAISRIKQFESSMNTPMDKFNEAGQEAQKTYKPLDIADVYNDYETAYGKNVADLKGKEFVENKQHARDRAEKLQDDATKRAIELETEAKENEGLIASFDFLEEKLPQVGITFGSVSGFNKVFDRQQLQDREEFSATGTQLADTAYSKVNKGTQSAEKIKLWKDEWAPNASLSERVNQARINSLKRFLNLPKDATKADKKKIEAQEKKKQKEAAKTLNVYDAKGILKGTVDAEQAGELPEGYTAK